MKKTILMVAVAIGFSSAAFAHDEGHGPKLKDSGRKGGVMAPVVLKSDSGSSANVLYKAELVRSGGMARVYLYDMSGTPVSAKSFGESAAALYQSKEDSKKAEKFSLKADDKAFVGKLPSGTAQNYSVEVTMKKDNQELLAAFQNLRNE